jgi:hypothetical protein
MITRLVVAGDPVAKLPRCNLKKVKYSIVSKLFMRGIARITTMKEKVEEIYWQRPTLLFLWSYLAPVPLPPYHLPFLSLSLPYLCVAVSGTMMGEEGGAK